MAAASSSIARGRCAPTLVREAQFLQAARQGHLSRTCPTSLGVLAVWDGEGDTEYGLVLLPTRACRRSACACMLPPHLAAEAAADLGASWWTPLAYEAHRIALGVPRGGVDFIYGDAFPHETDMDQLGRRRFRQGLLHRPGGGLAYGASRHRARPRMVPVAFDGSAPMRGMPVMRGRKAGRHHGLRRQRPRPRACCALIASRDALAEDSCSSPAASRSRSSKPDWARFAWPDKTKAAE